MSTAFDDTPKTSEPSPSPVMNTATTVVVVLVVVVIVVAVGWAIFLRPKPISQEELAAKEIVGKTLFGPSKDNTCPCTVKAVNAREGIPGEPGGPYATSMLVDCEVKIHPSKGTATRVVTSPPEKYETDTKLHISFRSGDKEIGRATIPSAYLHGKYVWLVREVYFDASYNSAN